MYGSRVDSELAAAAAAVEGWAAAEMALEEREEDAGNKVLPWVSQEGEFELPPPVAVEAVAAAAADAAAAVARAAALSALYFAATSRLARCTACSNPLNLVPRRGLKSALPPLLLVIVLVAAFVL